MYFILLGSSDYSLWLFNKKWRKNSSDTVQRWYFNFTLDFELKFVKESCCFGLSIKIGNGLKTWGSKNKIWFKSVILQIIFFYGRAIMIKKLKEGTSKQGIIFFGRKGHFSTLIASLLALLWPEVRRQVWKFKPFVFTELFTW